MEGAFETGNEPKQLCSKCWKHLIKKKITISIVFGHVIIINYGYDC